MGPRDAILTDRDTLCGHWWEFTILDSSQVSEFGRFIEASEASEGLGLEEVHLVDRHQEGRRIPPCAIPAPELVVRLAPGPALIPEVVCRPVGEVFPSRVRLLTGQTTVWCGDMEASDRKSVVLGKEGRAWRGEDA